jgi:hypothetical protein
MQSQRQEVQYQRDQKEVSMDSIHAGRRAKLRGHEANAGFSIGNAMAARSDENSSAFQGAGVFMPDIHNIAKDLDEEELELKEKKEAKKMQNKKQKKNAEEEEEQEEQEEDNQDEVTGDKGWFDESFVLKQSRAAQAATSKLQEQLTKTMQEALAALKSSTASDQTPLPTVVADKEQNVLKYRLAFLVAALGYNPPQDWVDEPLETAHDGGWQRMGALIRDAAGKRPPCELYAEIHPIGLMLADFGK